ncbi:MAG: tRNA (adenosine(37)-N6)-threonylcarbamoyltransferase complex ATPase subunit type 1 TsaE [Myxococcota bacterium]|nr:tRNA (adenosine(37)-N6)-threonylcarbamoyltransferase complex ATPase subunit type 1 TsaE [Myxococcota bacterium]
MISVRLKDADATYRFGTALGEAAVPGLVFAVEGNLGSGKTTLAQGVARGLSVPLDHYVNSPTFAILLTHPGRLQFHHMDLYRLGCLDEAYGIGLDEVIGSDGVSFIEWPSQVPDLIPQDVVSIRLDYAGDQRQVFLAASGSRSSSFLARCAYLNTFS